MNTKDHVKLTTKVDGVDKVYSGRFVGFIKNDEFNALIQNIKKVSPRIESKATQSIIDIATKFDDVSGHRFVMVVKKINSIMTIKKTLFISKPIDIISTVVPEAKDAVGNTTMGKVTFKYGNKEEMTVQEIE